MENIIQIVPAPAGMLLKYREDDGSITRLRPLCLALFQNEDGGTEIKVMDIDSCGYIDTADSLANFAGIEWVTEVDADGG